MTSDPPNLALLPAGLSDLLPPEAEREAAIVESMLGAFGRHGYERVKPPLLEFEESLLSGSGAAVSEQTFRLMDPVSQRMMGLRADTTPQVARIAATRLAGVKRPLRLCYAGQVLRVRGQPLAPERQLAQTGIELIGSASAAADAEVATVAVEALAAIGITEVSLDITLPTMTVALFDEAGISGEARQRLARALDRKDAAAVAERIEGAGAALRSLPALLAAAGPVDGALAVLDESDLPPTARAIAANAAEVVEAIRARAPELRVTLDPVEFRGFRYHTGVAFTLFGRGRVGELGRGGRYVSLNEETATGMSLYPDAVLRAAPAMAPAPRVFLPIGTAASVGRSLRARGFSTIAALDPGDTPASLRCSHIIRDGVPVALNAEKV